jgi:hypothetical protein
MTRYKIIVNNDYNDTAGRKYCVVAETPVVKVVGKGEIRQPELRIPVCHRSGAVAYKGQTDFWYTDAYCGFVGELTYNDSNNEEIALRSQESVRLGEATDNGTQLNAWVKPFPSIKPDDGTNDHSKQAKEGAFNIYCISRVSDSNKYMVGLAQKVGKDYVPVAAVPYKYGHEYSFWPGDCMRIFQGDNAPLEVVSPDKNTFKIPLSDDTIEIRISENSHGDFLDPDKHLLQPSKEANSRPPKTRPEPQRGSAVPSPPSSPPPRKEWHSKKYEDFEFPVSEEARKANFESDRQVWIIVKPCRSINSRLVAPGI